MKTSTQAVAGALTSVRERATTVAKVNTQAWAKWFNFQTLGDKQLEKMVEESARFILDMKAKQTPRWLSLVGTSGAGKTYLAKKIFGYVTRQKIFNSFADMQRDELKYATEFCEWQYLGGQLQVGGGRSEVAQLVDTQFVVMDDIGAKLDKTGFITGELSTLLSQRTGKWTLITANYGLREIAEKIDPRVASRMIRDGGVVVDVDVKDFAMRKKL